MDLPPAVEWLLRLSIRGSVALYAAFWCTLLWRGQSRTDVLPRALWTTSWCLYVVHMLAALGGVHGWSHDLAWAHTAQTTEQFLGLSWGGGIYFNYAFSIVWTLDVLWWWLFPAHYLNRPAIVAWSIHVYLAFIIFNGAIVFASWPSRLVAACGCAAIAVAAGVRRGRSGPKIR